MGTINHLKYMPVLKWRQGEYQALLRLNDEEKDVIVPMIEITPPDFDFETGKPKKTLDEHFEEFAPRFEKKWGSRLALLDAGLLAPSARMIGGIHGLTWLLNEARLRAAQIIPVTGLERDTAYQIAVRDAHVADAHGVALRCSLEDATDTDFSKNVAVLLTQLKIGLTDLDLILDLKSPNFQPIAGLVQLIRGTLNGSSVFKGARSTTIVGTSFPSSMGEVTGPIQLFPREEWRLYKALIAAMPAGERIPGFGDYAIAAPDLPKGDMRILKPSATVRYAVDDGWLIAKGVNVRDHGFGQYRGCCGTVTGSPQYLGSKFSAGSDYIERCRAGTAKTGNLTTWRWVGTNHHMTKIVRDLSSFHGP
jgi:hypothetical protein